jgi:serine/threonine protein kinase
MEPGDRVGRYHVIAPIGRGGMGGVYEVEDASGIRYALKAPIQDVGSSTEVTRRFAREANVLRVLDHPNLVAAADVFVDDGRLCLVMEKVAGRTLTKSIAEGLTPRQALVITRQILEGAGHAHAQGIVHRDLKPDNVLLVPQGGWERVKLIDFGIAKLLGDAVAAFGGASITRTGTVSGTPMYMAPEQALGRVVDARADLYAIGIMLFEMLAGKPPFRDRDPLVMMRMQVKSPLPSLLDLVPGCTPKVATLVEGALAKEPAQRFPSAQQMIHALDTAFATL